MEEIQSAMRTSMRRATTSLMGQEANGEAVIRPPRLRRDTSFYDGAQPCASQTSLVNPRQLKAGHQVAFFTIWKPLASNSRIITLVSCAHSFGMIQLGLLQSGSSSFG